MKMKRRDLMDASRLLQRHGLAKAGEMDTPSLMLAVNYLAEKRSNETELGFLEWLDEDFDEADLQAAGEDDDEDEPDPTPPAPAAKRPAKKATAPKRPRRA